MKEYSQGENISYISVADEMSKSFLDYSMSVIIARALPDVRDGLKPSQRRILYAMHELNLQPGRPHKKCAKICGDTSGNYHPHGESVVYPTLVNMAQPWSMRECLIDGQGNFGSVEGDPPAAMRYTEARLTHLGVALMKDIDKDTVDFVPNYNEEELEPTVLPAAFPNLLVNGGTGIAVGMATNIPPHNLGEVIDAICAQIDNPNISSMELNQYIQGPDFPTGCTIEGTKGIKQYFNTGRGAVKVKGSLSIEELRGGREAIIITEIPYGVNRAVLHEKIGQLVSAKILVGISAIRDESDENTRLVVELRRDAHAQVIVNNLYKHTQLATSYSSNILAIDNLRPRLLPIKDAIACYIEHRREVILRRTRFLLRKARAQAELLEAYLIAISKDYIDEFIKLIRDSKNRKEAAEKLKKYEFSQDECVKLGVLIYGQKAWNSERKNKEGGIGSYLFTDRQIDAILNLRLYQLTAMERDKIKHDYDRIIAEIKDLLDILARESRVLDIIKDELLEIKTKYATPRRTRIIADEGDIRVEDLIANDSFIITFTHRGFLKRTLANEYKSQRRGGVGLKGMETRAALNEDEKSDFIEMLFSATAHDYLLFFTNKGLVYVERVYGLPDMGRTAKGKSIKNFLNLRGDEKVAAVLRVDGSNDGEQWKDEKYIFFATKQGIVKKTALSQFKNFRKDGLKAIKLDGDDELIGVKLTGGNDDVYMVTRHGLCARFSEQTIRSMGRVTRGVIGIKPRGDDYVVTIGIVQDNSTLLVVSEKALGKRTDFDEYNAKGRAGKGIITMKTTDRTGFVLGALSVSDQDDIMLMTNKGQSVRINAGSISKMGRNAQGVILMKLKKGELIKDVAQVAADESEADESEEN